MLKHLQIKHQEFTFVDFGSGKGRALLLASEYPFKQVIGVEFSPELNEVAQRNIQTYKSSTQKCKNLTSVCMDAANLTLPSDNLLLYMSNPFKEQVMTRILENIQKSMEAYPRELYIVYFNPQCDHLFDRTGFLTKIKDKGWFSIYTYNATAGRKELRHTA